MPGSDGLIKDDTEAVTVSRQIGFPIMIKATAGGGGRGMRLAMTEKDFLPLLQQAAQVRLSQGIPILNFSDVQRLRTVHHSTPLLSMLFLLRCGMAAVTSPLQSVMVSGCPRPANM